LLKQLGSLAVTPTFWRWVASPHDEWWINVPRAGVRLPSFLAVVSHSTNGNTKPLQYVGLFTSEAALGPAAAA